jgi:hypothetical protein
MTESVSPGHGAAATSAMPFSAAEWGELQADDYAAARAIVLLMMSIFIMGVIGYLCVCFWVAS